MSNDEELRQMLVAGLWLGSGLTNYKGFPN